MKEKYADTEETMKQIQKIFKKRGTKALELARKEILLEKLECKEAKEALTYFMTNYWHDLTRPSLMSIVCEAVGGDPELTTPIAIPMSLISGAIDIHDDIIDQSKHKYGRPTVYGKYGKDVAILVGDALLFKGLTLLNKTSEKDIPTEKMRIIIDIVKNMFFELGDAEALELRFRGNLDVSSEEYLRVVRKKAADVESYTRISAMLGGGGEKEINALGRYGRILGMMAILTDDWADTINTKEFLHRIRHESLPYPVISSLENPRAKLKIQILLSKGVKTKEDAQEILKITQAREMKNLIRLLEELSEEACLLVKDLKRNRRYLQVIARSMVVSLSEDEESNTRI